MCDILYNSVLYNIIYSHVCYNGKEKQKMNEEIRKIIDKALQDEFKKGYLQGVWDFLQELKKTHKLPIEIFEELASGKK